MNQTRFGRRILAAMLGLTFLTALVGGIGLILTQRVKSTFLQMADEYEPFLRDMDDLAVYLDRAIRIAHEAELQTGSSQISTLRRRLDRATQDFESLYAHMVETSVDHESFLSMINELQQEHEEFAAEVSRFLRDYSRELAIRERLDQARLEVIEATEGLSPLVRNLDDTGAAAVVADLALRLFNRQTELERLPSQNRLQEIEFGIAGDFREVREQLQQISGLDASRATALRAIIDDLESAMLGERGYIPTFRAYVNAQATVASTERALTSEINDTVRTLNSVASVAEVFVSDSAGFGLLNLAPPLMIAAVAMALVLSILFAILLSRSVARPVAELKHATLAVAEGDFSYSLRLESGDELEELAKAFNFMARRIATGQSEIESLNESLERRVEERTLELEREVENRRVTEESLADSERRYRTLIKSFPSGAIALVASDWSILAAGGKDVSILALYPGTLLDTVTGMTDLSGKPIVLTDFLKPVFRHQRRIVECNGYGKRWIIRAVPNGESSDSVTSITLLFTDITELRKAQIQMQEQERQLFQADKMASLGVLVAGVAHEISNPNQSVRMAATVVKRFWDEFAPYLEELQLEDALVFAGYPVSELPEAIPAHLESIQEASARIDRIVKGLKDFAREGPGNQLKAVDLNMVVRSALFLVDSMLRAATDEFELHLAPELPPIIGDEQRIEQLLINLLQNACQALGDRSDRITVTTEHDTDRQQVCLMVSDEGSGIPDEVVEKVQDPFFTTKHASGGTGLGLSIASTIIRDHKGSITIRSAVDEGTEVVCTFPIAEQRGG